MTQSRRDARRDFAEAALGARGLDIEPASADASFRSYWRVRQPSTSTSTCIVMDAPPEREDLGSWLDVGARLRAAGLHAPAVLAVDRAQGFVLMEDLGTRIYLPTLDDSSVDGLYADAFKALVRMQGSVDGAGLPPYDRTLLIAELELLPEWFLARHLGITPSCDEWDVIEAAFTFLIHAAMEQPRVFVHRDFHSRNLLVVEADSGSSAMPTLSSPGIIDFQDAVIGPITYDLASLLRDCYVEWDIERVDAWMESCRECLRHSHLIGPDVNTALFRRWFDLAGLQRHLKVLGIFCRLWYRDGKPQYLADLKLVWHYAITVARRYPELSQFVALLERARGDRDLVQPRPGTAA